jgi:hypothetical protein
MYNKALSPAYIISHKKSDLLEWSIILSGFLPVTCIALHVSQIISLDFSAAFILMPGIIFLMCLGLKYPETGKLMIRGWLIGLLAVLLYDCSRIPFILAGWNDFVPHIGDWMLNKKGASSWIGYLWRYAGNGGGMGIAFLFLTKYSTDKNENIVHGIIYGLLIFSSLILTLVLAPQAESLMFKISPLSFTGSLLGHIIYGGVLGLCARTGNDRMR